MTKGRKVFLRVAILMGAATFVFAVVRGIPMVQHAAAVQRHLIAAAGQEQAVRAEWTELFGDPSRLVERFPSAADDSVAIEVAERAQELGIEMHPPERPPGSPRKTPEDRKFESVGRYVREQVERVSGDVEPPPAEVCAYLDEHRHAIAEMARFLARSKPAQWEASPASFDGPSPNLLAHRRIQQVLLADALARSIAGEDDDAQLRLLAAWQLNASIRDRLDGISQIIALANAHLHVGVARRLALDESAWLERLGDHDYRASLKQAVAVQAAAGARIFDGDSRFSRGSRADYYRIHLDLLESCEAATIAESARGQVVVEEKPEHMLSAGGIVAGFGLPNTANSWRRANRLRLDTELTLKVLEARRAKRHNGRWPERIAGVERSILGEPHWVYAVDGGQMRIGLSAPLEWRNWNGVALPLEFTSN